VPATAWQRASGIRRRRWRLAVIGLSNNDVISLRSLRCVRCVGWKPRFILRIKQYVKVYRQVWAINTPTRVSETDERTFHRWWLSPVVNTLCAIEVAPHRTRLASDRQTSPYITNHSSQLSLSSLRSSHIEYRPAWLAWRRPRGAFTGVRKQAKHRNLKSDIMVDDTQ